MNINRRIFSIFTVILLSGTSGAFAAAAKCSVANLTRCLDSACAINASSNPAARCQYCGTSSAGEPPTGTMRSVSVGASAKYTISDKDLKKAPTDPGERYTWATSLCLAKVAGCTPDDVTDKYDPLIEQSCTAAGISAQTAKLADSATKDKSETACRTEIESCMTADNHCASDYSKCEDDGMFDKYFAECGALAAGCDKYLVRQFTNKQTGGTETLLRDELLSARNAMIKNTDNMLAAIVVAYQNARAARINAAKNDCKNKAMREQCINNVCQATMRNKCDASIDKEVAEREYNAALSICKFYDTACATLE